MGPNLICIICKRNRDDLTVKPQLCLDSIGIQNLQLIVINHARTLDSRNLIKGDYFKA